MKFSQEAESRVNVNVSARLNVEDLDGLSPGQVRAIFNGIALVLAANESALVRKERTE